MNAKTSAIKISTPLRVLIVDDDEFMLSFVGDMLRELGVSDVKTARDGKEGSKVFEQEANKPNVVLCDLNMPGADGFEFMEMMAKRNYKGGVILVSGMDSRTMNSAALMAKFHRLNILATIGKPVDEDSLAKALAKMV